MNIEFGGGENPRKKDYRQVDIRKIREDDISIVYKGNIIGGYFCNPAG